MSRCIVLVLVLSLLTMGGLAARTGSAFELRRQVWTAAAASRVSGGAHVLSSTLGEGVVVGIVSASGRSVGQGFWPGITAGGQVAVPEIPPQTSPPAVNRLSPNAPNPFQHGTSLAFDVAEPSPVRLRVFDVSGRQVSVLVNGPFSPGRYEVSWSGVDESGRPLASGVYFYRLEIGAWSQTRKMLKVR
jgi:hypothetical protein